MKILKSCKSWFRQKIGFDGWVVRMPAAKPSAVLASASLSYRGSVLRRSSVTIAYRLVERRGERLRDACGIFWMLAKVQSRKGLGFFKGAKGLADGSRSDSERFGMPAAFVGCLTVTDSFH